jgi:hypothetical protein
MRAPTVLPALLVAIALAGGCASSAGPVTARGQAPAAARGDDPQDSKEKPDKDKNGKAKDGDEKKENGDKKDGDEKDKKKDKGPPKTLFEWAIGPEEDDKPEEEDWIETDRPDFTESAKTVGLGRVQLEAGYTYTRDRAGGTNRITQTYPEALLRIGVLADWFELRIGPNYVHSRTTAFGRTNEHLSGLDDLYLGVKLALTEEKGYLPETGIIFQASVPTGGPGISAEEILPGVNFVYGVDVIKDFLSVSGEFMANRAIDADGHGYVELAQSVSLGYKFSQQFAAYTEWFAFYPTGATAPGVTAQYYFDGGFTYKLTPDLQFDVRAGWGLSRRADDFFAGAGFAVRY